MDRKGTSWVCKACILGDSSCGIDKGGCFAENSSHCKDNAWEDTAYCRRQNDNEDSSELSCAKSVAALTEAVVYRFQRFLGRTDHERKHHYRQCASAWEHWELPVEGKHKEHISEKSVDYGRDTWKCFGSKSYYSDEFIAFLCILNEIYCAEYAQRCGYCQGHQKHFKGVHDSGEHWHVFGGIGLCEEGRFQIRNALYHHIAHNKNEHAYGKHNCYFG